MRQAARWALVLGLWAQVGLVPVLTADDAPLHKLAPQIARRDLAGKDINLRAYRGKVVLLSFWATWCGPCRQELPRFAAWQRQYGADGFQVVSVSMDDGPDAVRAVVKKLHVAFPVVMGDAQIGRRYGGVLGLPVTFLIARDGTVAARYGDDDLAKIEKEIQQLLAVH